MVRLKVGNGPLEPRLARENVKVGRLYTNERPCGGPNLVIFMITNMFYTLFLNTV